MSLDIIDGRHFFRIYHARCSGVDVLGAVYRDPEKAPIFRYRFRYYVDERHFGSADRKSWTTATCPPTKTVEEFLADIETLFLPELVSNGFEIGIIYVDSGDKLLVLEALQKVPGTKTAALGDC